jgi:hypothetical protein
MASHRRLWTARRYMRALSEQGRQAYVERSLSTRQYEAEDGSGRAAKAVLQTIEDNSENTRTDIYAIITENGPGADLNRILDKIVKRLEQGALCQSSDTALSAPRFPSLHAYPTSA